MNAGARRVGLICVATSVAGALAGCYPASFHGPGGDGGVDGISDVDGTSDVVDGMTVRDVAQDVLQPFGNCVAPVMCGGNVCPAGRCTTGTPVGCDPLGDGVDPDNTTFSRGTLVTTTTGLNLTPNVDAPLEVTDSSVFTPGHEALLYVVTGPEAGTFAPVVVHCIASATQIFIVSPVAFRVTATAQMQLVPVRHFMAWGTLTGTNDVTTTMDPLIPNLGGIIAVRVQGQLSARIIAHGYLGGTAPAASGAGGDGRSSGSFSPQATAGHGGVWCSGATCTSGGNGGGGANVTAGLSASMAGSCAMPPAAGGTASMMETRFIAAFGTGGGSGANTTGTAPGAGGAGGGAVFVAAQSFFGQIDVSGADGIATGSSPGGGGGGGGTIVFVMPMPTASMGTSPTFNAQGGSGAVGNCEGNGGNGGDGVVRVYCTSIGGVPCGTGSNPVPSALPSTTTHDLSQSPF